MADSGVTIALHCTVHNRFARLMENAQGDSAGTCAPDAMPKDWRSEWFVLIDAGVDESGRQQYGLYNTLCRRFLRANANNTVDSAESRGPDLPGDWNWERFVLIDARNNQTALYSPTHHRFVSMNTEGKLVLSGVINPPESIATNAGLTWERFVVVPDISVAFHNRSNNRFFRLNGGGCDTAEPKAIADMPKDWTWEWFVPVSAGFDSAGRSLVAFYSRTHRRFLRANIDGFMDASAESGPVLPQDWTWERFLEVEVGQSEVALYSPYCRRFVRMKSNGSMDLSDPVDDPQQIPLNWLWSRFRMVTNA